jgi:hypothetical protein
LSEFSLSNTALLFLEPKVYAFETVHVEAKGFKKYTLGYDILPMPLNRIRYSSWGGFGSSVAIRLDFDDSNATQYIQTLEIALYDNPFDSTLIRFSLKTVTEDNYPGKIVFQSPILVGYDKTKRWITYDFGEELFPVTTKSLFLVVENFIPDSDEFSILKPKFSFLFHHRKSAKTPVLISNPSLKKWLYSPKQVVYRVKYLSDK